MFRRVLAGCALCAALFVPGCGDNITPDLGVFKLLPPVNVQAFSAGSARVSLQWTAPKYSTDPKFAGYRIQWGTRTDTVAAGVVTYVADSLPTGVTVFSISSRSTTRDYSTPVAISWAPADRFDTGIVLYEFNTANKDTNQGLHIGNRLSDPAVILFNDPQVVNLVDVYLTGEGAQPLRLKSANVYNSLWNQTVFSTQIDSAGSLDTYLTAFPDVSTFTLSDVAVQNNMICYARIRGYAGETNYVRLHVTVTSGAVFPNRSVRITISLQRIPALLYASTDQSFRKSA